MTGPGQHVNVVPLDHIPTILTFRRRKMPMNGGSAFLPLGGSGAAHARALMNAIKMYFMTVSPGLQEF